MGDYLATHEPRADLGNAREQVAQYLRDCGALVDNPNLVADRSRLALRRHHMRALFMAVWLDEGRDTSTEELERLEARIRSLAQLQPGIGEGFVDLRRRDLDPRIVERLRRAIDRDRKKFASPIVPA